MVPTRNYKLSEAVVNKTFDADFQTVMKSVGFVDTPREVLSVKDVEKYHILNKESVRYE